MAFLFVFTSCRDDEDVTTPTDTPIDTDSKWGVNMITGSLAGQVFEISNLPIPNAEVTVNGQTQMTDENGVFIFENVEMNAFGTVVAVSSPDHFDYSKVVNTKEGKQSIVNFGMHKKDNSKIFNTEEGTTINISSTGYIAEVVLPSGAYVIDGTDVPFEGNVKAHLTFINPVADEHQSTIPGDLRAVGSEGELVQLASFAMIGLELHNEVGDKLNLSPDQEATIKFPIPSELQANAPDVIPLWAYNESTGDWEEEGQAEKDGNLHYLGTVKHFSFWNCDAPFPLVKLNGRVVDEKGVPLSGVSVKVEVLSSGMCAFGTTDSEGIYKGKVPKNENLKVTIFKSIPCEEIFGMIEVEASSEDINLGDQVFASPEFNTISGRLLNCDQELTVSGYLKLSANNVVQYDLIIWPNDEGYFSVDVPNCWTDFTISGYDYEGGFVSEPIQFSLGLDEDIDLNEFLLCKDIETYFTVDFEGETQRVDGVIGMQNAAGGLSLFTSSQDSTGMDPSFSFTINDIVNEISTGTYTPNYSFVSFSKDEVNYYLYCPANDGCVMILELETVQPIGGFITGTYEGTLINELDPDNSTQSITGTFRAYREQ